MKKKNLTKRIKEKIGEFFKEEEYEDEEEINLKTLIIIFLIGFTIIISTYLYSNKDFKFIGSGLDEKSEFNDFEDYSIGENILENSNFLDGKNHWNTSDGGEFSNDSVSERIVNKQDYYSPTTSLQINCSQPPCRINYGTKPHSIILDYPYDLKSETWINIKPKIKGSIEPETKLMLSYWYKGNNHVFYFMGLDKNGNFDNLEEIENQDSTEWVKNELIVTIPKDKIAIGIEITMNFEGTLLVDDIRLERIE